MKKELVEASFLAVVLAAGLGTLSYALFAGIPPVNKLEPVLDVYTAKGGIGSNASGGSFEVGDRTPIYAYVTVGGIGVNGNKVTFRMNGPNGRQTVTSAVSNYSGIAEAPLSFLPSQGQLIGDWQIMANTSANDEAINDMMMLRCRFENARVDLSLKKNGAVRLSFLPKDEVLLEAKLSYRNASITDAPITFEIKTPDGMDLFSPPYPTANTDKFGTANVTFQIPWPSNSSLGTWQAKAMGEIYGEKVNQIMTFNCMLVSPVVDVYTGKGGHGPNISGGDYRLNESIVFYAEMRGTLNETLPNYLVSYEVELFQDSSGLGPILDVAETDAFGIANSTMRIPSPAEYTGIWTAYVTAQYNDMLLIDTLTFKVQP